MAADRPKRRIAIPPPVEHDNSKWTLKEKRRIQRALLKYSPKQIDNIAKIVGTKKVKEVKAYLDEMEQKLKRTAENRPKEAMELWGTLASDLISCETKDYSEVLSEVMSVCSNMENPTPLTQSQDEQTGPDYNSIYHYISAILAGEDLPFLGKTECSIVLDLMHGLIDTVRTHETSKQQEIMLQKYQLLTSKIDLNNTMLHVERCRKAINNDFSDFQTANKAATGSNIGGPSTSASSAGNSVPSTSTGDTTTDSGRRKRKGRPSKRQQAKSCSSAPAPSKKSKSSEDLSHAGKEIQSNADTDKNQANATNSGGSNTTSSAKRTATSQKADERTGQVSTAPENQPSSSSENTTNNSATASDQSNTNQQTGQPNQGDGIRKKEEIPKKPALFTLNPFCIPIDLLKFQRLVSPDVVFNPVMKKHQQVTQVYPMRPYKPREQTNSKKQLEVICVDEKHDVIGREKFISVVPDDPDKNTQD